MAFFVCTSDTLYMYRAVYIPSLSFVGLAFLTFLVYFPGLQSGFILDDHSNLQALERISSNGYIEYLLGGSSGPSGRPISLLSFALQAEHWPDNPFAFKLLNLIIHLANGFLVYQIVSLLLAGKEQFGLGHRWLALAVTALWLLHPVQVSTVLYTVQRMTLLSSFFMLCGIYVYLCSRNLYREGYKKAGLGGLLLSVFLFTPLAVLSKEIGVLLPLYIVVIEYTLLQGQILSREWRYLSLTVLLSPLILLLVYIGLKFDNTVASYAWRPFTMEQRLLTETVVLLDYMKVLVFPHPAAFSLYHDDYPISTGLFSPPVTMVCVLLTGVLICLALFLRRKMAIVSFAILWFYAGHSLESSIFGLELYFEHRNYLPSIGVFFLLGISAIKLLSLLKTQTVTKAILVMYFLLTVTVTVMEVSLWRNTAVQIVEWARLHPQSQRALDDLWGVYAAVGETDKAKEVYISLQELDESDIYPTIRNMSIRYCVENSTMDKSDWDFALAHARTAEFRGVSIIAVLSSFFYAIFENDCFMPDRVYLLDFLQTLANNPDFNIIKGDLHEFATTIAVSIGDNNRALENINKAVKHSPTIANNIYLARVLVGQGRIDEAENMHAQISALLESSVRQRLLHREALDTLRETINSAQN